MGLVNEVLPTVEALEQEAWTGRKRYWASLRLPFAF